MDSTLQARLKCPRPFKAAGGKTWLVQSRISAVWKNTNNEHRRLFDPFVGGGALPFLVQPSNCLVADANPYLIHAYRWLQSGANRQIPYSHEESDYYDFRHTFNAKRDSADHAWLGEAFFLLNRSCHRGLWRVNSSGEFNVPWGHYKSFPTINLNHYSEMVKGWQILSSGYIETINDHLQDDDFLFLDPPYDETFDHYITTRFCWEDHRTLAAIAGQHPGPAIICNSPTKRVIELYERAGLTVEIIDKGGQCMQAGKPGAKKKVSEIFAYNRNVQP